MQKELIISTTPQETKVAILEDDELVEFYIERHRSQGIVGNIYKGKVTKVLPGMQSAFVDIGLERDAFLYVSDFFEDADEYDKLVSTAEEQVEKLAQPTGVLGPNPIGPNTLPDGTTAPPAGNRFQDRRGRSRRARRFRLRGKHYEGNPPTSPSPTVPPASVSSEVAPPPASNDGNDALVTLSPLPGESLAKYPEPSE